MNPTTFNTVRWQSPAGELIVGSIGDRLALCDWPCRKNFTAYLSRYAKRLGAKLTEGSTATTEKAICQLAEYFSGERREFDMPLEMPGTEFQQQVWRALLRVPYGSTLSYLGLAELMGRPTAVRAVATAVGDNPMSIFVPCHRIIGADGSLTGYAGGIEAKRILLNLEHRGL